MIIRQLREDFSQLGSNLAEANERRRRGELVGVVNRTIEHSSKFDLIAVFNAEIDEFEVGRILLFRDFIEKNTGLSPRPVKTMAMCIKVFFDLGDEWRDRKAVLERLFCSEAFKSVRRGLDLSYVQFAGQIFPPQKADC